MRGWQANKKGLHTLYNTYNAQAFWNFSQQGIQVNRQLQTDLIDRIVIFYKGQSAMLCNSAKVGGIVKKIQKYDWKIQKLDV